MTRKEALEILDTIPTIGEQVDALELAIKALEAQPCEDAISRQAAIDSVRAGVLSTAMLYGRTEEGETARKEIERTIKALPSVNPQANNEDIHRKREQAYMKGYEDAIKRYRTEPCDDAISRTDAIRVASGYCHWSNIPDELAKLPSVNPIPCEDAISRQAAIAAIWNGVNMDIYTREVKECLEQLPSVSTEKTWQMSGAQYLEDIANGKFNEPYTCVSIKIGNETKHICVVNCSSICHNPRCACEKNKDVCPNCGCRMVEQQESEDEE